MRTKDHQLLEEAYDKVVKNPLMINPHGVQGIGTRIRPNNSFSHINDKGDWDRDGDGRFQGIKLNTSEFDNWSAQLKYANQIINIESEGQEVWVDGHQLTFEERLDLRRYIRKNYKDNMKNPYEINPPAFNGKGEPV